jgi:IS30 family transposase
MATNDASDRLTSRTGPWRGHWEGDLLCGSSNSHIATLVERSTRYAMPVEIDCKDTKTVVDPLIEHARQLPNKLHQSLTCD